MDFYDRSNRFSLENWFLLVDYVILLIVLMTYYILQNTEYKYRERFGC